MPASCGLPWVRSGLRPLPGEWGKRIAEWIWNLRVPVGAVWELLPWNKGPPKCGVKLVRGCDFREAACWQAVLHAIDPDRGMLIGVYSVLTA